jgi:hypothetical protein
LIDAYETRGHREAMLRFGPDAGPVAVVALPLFEEANRMRAFAVAICRALSERGFASVLPDLPGQGESLVPLEECGILTISDGYESAARLLSDEGRPVYGVALRSGALLCKSGPLKNRWQFSPQDGASLVRDLKRIKQAALGRTGKLSESWYFDSDHPEGAPAAAVEVAGNVIPADLLDILSAYPLWSGETRTVRLESDPKPADRHLPGPPLWRRAEPGNDLPLAALLADDIADWIAACEG